MSAFRDFIRPFAEDFVWIYTEDPGQASEAVDTLAGAIEAWARNVFDYMTEINHSTFARIRDFATLLNRELIPLRYERALKPGGNTAILPALEHALVLVNKRDDVTRAQAVAGGYYLRHRSSTSMMCVLSSPKSLRA